MRITLYLKRLAILTTILLACVGLAFVLVFFAMKFKFTNTAGLIDTQQDSFLELKDGSYTSFPLAHTPEWISFRIAVAKDQAVIARVAKETGVSPRVLITPLVPEQMRLFHSDRPLFKEVFEPLKILGAQSQFSWGIAGIKEETAREVERRLKDPSSPSYLGKDSEHLLDFSTDNPDEERFQRIISERNHYYAYLYTALFIKEMEAEWRAQGFDISRRPEILATLYNIGFARSVPKDNPQTGGAALDINGTEYSFGHLAGLFYYSDELVELFPCL